MQKLAIGIIALLGCISNASAATPEVVSVKKIWDQGKHNAFTDLVRFKDKWFCTFRESDAHVGGNGLIRILSSTDGATWQSAAAVTEEGIDLRDPKLTQMPDGRLMLLMGGSTYEGKKLLGLQPRVAFSADGETWSAPQKVLSQGDWLWRVTWHDGVAWGTSYRGKHLWLFKSTDGIKWDTVKEFPIDGRPNETALRFLKDGTMVALVRREEGNKNGWIGTSPGPAYTEWNWTEVPHRLGGPEFVVMDDGSMWAGGRDWTKDSKNPKMVIATMTTTTYEPVLALPSGGDCSYPGMVYHDGILWVSYYASHEGKSAIYLAKLRLPQ